MASAFTARAVARESSATATELAALARESRAALALAAEESHVTEEHFAATRAIVGTAPCADGVRHVNGGVAPRVHMAGGGALGRHQRRSSAVAARQREVPPERALQRHDGGISPLTIAGYNDETAPTTAGRTGVPTQYARDRKAFVDQLGGLVNDTQKKVDQGADPGLFLPARGQNTEVPGKGWPSGDGNEPSLGKLKQHQRTTVVDNMEAQKTKDEAALKEYTGAT